MHEGSTNSTKCLVWLCICASILKYAEDIKRGLNVSRLTIKEILEENIDPTHVTYIMAYLEHRKNTFFTSAGSYKTNYKAAETKWFFEDPEFTFKHNNIEIK